MFRILTRKLSRLYWKLRWPLRRRSKSKSEVDVKTLGKSNPKSYVSTNEASIHPSGEQGKPISVATFNAGLFSMAPAVPKAAKSASFDFGDEDFRKDNHIHVRAKSMDHRPKSILKQSPLHPNSLNSQDNNTNNLSKQQRFSKSKLRVSINLPDNEISLKKSGQLQLSFLECDESGRGKSPLHFSSSTTNGLSYRSTRTVVEVLRELNADVVALQDVKAEEERGMKPLSDLAAGLGMNFVFAESWAPEYGNAILSKWPIKSCKVQKIFDDSDFRNVMKATIAVPEVGEINFFCTLLDHLDENWRMKQINAIIQSSDTPHILAGGLNSLDEADYSPQRWAEIVKYYEEMGKPTPKVEVMKYLKSKQYCDAKDFGGECESVVMIAKGQCVQGTCKYGTRVDYILSSPDSLYKFVPGSYSVFSSKGTSDHHIVKVDVVKAADNGSHYQSAVDRKKQQKQKVKKRVVKKITDSNSSMGIRKTQR